MSYLEIDRGIWRHKAQNQKWSNDPQVRNQPTHNHWVGTVGLINPSPIKPFQLLADGRCLDTFENLYSSSLITTILTSGCRFVSYQLICFELGRNSPWEADTSSHTHTHMRFWPKPPVPSQIHTQHTPTDISSRTPLTGPVLACKPPGKMPVASGPSCRPTSRILGLARSWLLCSGALIADTLTCAGHVWAMLWPCQG